MALRLISVEKSTGFQGKTERWSNVYCYDTPASTSAELSALADALVALETPVHATNVTITRVRIYTREGLNGPGDPGNMYFVKDYTTAGTLPIVGAQPMYKEQAILCKFPLPRKVLGGGALGRQRSLKKWLHPCSSSGWGTGPATGEFTGTAPSYLTTYLSGIQVPVSGSQLVSPDGTLPSGAGTVHPYWEHRQFPRGRKET